MKIKYDKVIIWGHPLFSHTHSYVHEAYFKAFKHMGYDVYWFHDDDCPDDFDFSNCLFIGEGFADKKIPLNESSCYLIMYCPSLEKYVGKVGRYIDIRMAAVDFKDHIQEYSFDKIETINIGPACYFAPKKDSTIHVKNDYVDYEIEDFDTMYISWATNLLPEEFNFEDVYFPRENIIYFCGNLCPNGLCENVSTFRPFVNECQKNGIGFVHNNSWTNPLSSEEVILRTKRSALGIDIRGPQHLKQQLITCRVFKNISYGQLGLTNSPKINEVMDGNCVFNSDTAQLFYDGMNQRNDYEKIKTAMKFVRDNHTYINRINSILSVVSDEY